MSKLYNMYQDFKKQSPNTIFLFRSGIFYIALDKDAIYLSEKLNLKLINLNNIIKKVRFSLF